MEEQVILVDDQDKPLATMEKMEAHKRGLLHRAFSVQIADKRGYWLLQQRAKDKYHCPLLWSNTCCSHERPGEKTIDAAHRRLQEEMGLEVSLLDKKFTLQYRFEFPNGLIENEKDHVFFGFYSGDIEDIHPNPKEVEDHLWIPPQELITDLKTQPEQYTPWFNLIVEEAQKRKIISIH